VQVVIALIVTPEGFPLAYEVLAGNTSDKTTLRDFLKKIEVQYGKAERTWCNAPHCFVGLVSEYFVGKRVFGHVVAGTEDRLAPEGAARRIN
jgi:hypothetical protein